MKDLSSIAPTYFEIPDRYQEDQRKLFKPNWWALVKARSRDEVAEVLAYARSEGVVIVPFGGGTGLVGAQFYQGEDRAICLSLEALDQIELGSSSILCGAGVVLDQVHDKLAISDRHFPLHLASSGSAQIGGLISTNAGGVNVVRFGSMGALVQGLEAVLADGTIIDTTHDLCKDNTGYQLDRLLIGAEGTLGIITKARLKTFRRDSSVAVIMAEVPSPQAALEVFFELQTLPVSISAFELISGTGLLFRQSAGMKIDPLNSPPWSILVEIGGGEDAVEEGTEFLAEKFENAILAQNETQIKNLWNIRESIPLANRHIGAIASHDISLPIHLQPEFVEHMAAILANFELRINVFGHLGDGNLHYNLFPVDSRTKADYPVSDLSNLIYQNVVERGGSISAEHGIGRAKVDLMAAFGLEEKRAIMHKIKSALDPQNILNPGVFFSKNL